MNEHRFKVGSHHENEKGPFEILAIKGESMLIQWDGGEQMTTTVALQERILARMEKEANAPAIGKSRSSPAWMGKSFAGLLSSDFKDAVDGTHWRSRDQLGGAVTRLIEAREPMNSWSIYRRPEIHWAAISRHGTEAWFEAKFFIRLQAETGLYGYYVERSNERTETRLDWLNLMNWLADESHVVWLHGLLKKDGMRIFDPYPDYEQAFNRTIFPDGKGWRVESPSGKPHKVAMTDLSRYLAEIDESEWLNLMIGHQHPAEALVSQGVSVAAFIAACFNALLPVYENRSPQGGEQ